MKGIGKCFWLETDKIEDEAYPDLLIFVSLITKTKKILCTLLLLKTKK